MIFPPGQYPHCQIDWLIGVRFPKCPPTEAVVPAGIAGHLGLYTPHLVHKSISVDNTLALHPYFPV